MNTDFNFNTIKLSEIINELEKYYNNFIDAIKSLDIEIKKIGTSWKEESTLYSNFKEKYEEKRLKLIELSDMIKKILDYLKDKNNQLISAEEKTKNVFE